MRASLVVTVICTAGCGGFFFKDKKPVWIDPTGDTPFVITNNSDSPICQLSIEFTDHKEPPNADPYSVGHPHYRALLPLSDADHASKTNQLEPGKSITVSIKKDKYDLFVVTCDTRRWAKTDGVVVAGPAALGIEGPEKTAPPGYARIELALEDVPPQSESSRPASSTAECTQGGRYAPFNSADACCSGHGTWVSVSPERTALECL